MALVLSIVVAVLFGVAMYMLLQRTQMRIVIALLMLSTATNLMIFISGGVGKKVAPIVDGKVLSDVSANPVPQALILTAIVIGFGVIAYFIVLAQRLYATIGKQELDALKNEES